MLAIWMKPISGRTSQKASVLQQPQSRYLVRALRQLLQLTQVQLATELGVTYETINRWENGHMQPSPLAFKQLHFVLDRLQRSPSKVLQEGSQGLLKTYFADEPEKR